jgi:hypothetical protein
MWEFPQSLSLYFQDRMPDLPKPIYYSIQLGITQRPMPRVPVPQEANILP